jgi:geranylgeranyl diphosphate synthase, type II
MVVGRTEAEARAETGAASLSCPGSKALRERLRAMASDLVSSWRSGGMPPAARTSAGLRTHAETLVRRASARPEHVGWTMVTIVSEYWRDRLGAGPSGRRLLLLPDCPSAAVDAVSGKAGNDGVPRVCGPSCGIATIWAAARDSGWVVESNAKAVAAIGSLLTGQYDGILGVARLEDLEKAFAMLPAFSLPIAAVPFQPVSVEGTPRCCSALSSETSIDVEWVLGLLGVAGGSAPVADYLPLLREAAELFTPANLSPLVQRLGLDEALGAALGRDDRDGAVEPLDAAASMAGEFLARGGKFLRPFIALAAFDAVRADLEEQSGRAATPASGSAPPRESVKAASVAIEIFHKASLVHDDIEDDDTMRYGEPTLHVQRGVASALNAGDYMLGLGYRIITALPGVNAAAQRDLVAILADAHVRLARGQGAEIWWRDAADKRLSPAEAIAIYGLKTSPAFEAAVAMGIRLAGLQPADAAAIDRYALHVGTGFQVLNDLKDWSGDLENDRRAAGDLLGGRPTLMWALALERLSRADAERLLELAAASRRPDADDASAASAIATARRLYDGADVLGRAAAIVAEQRSLAAAAVATCRLRRLREVLEFLLDLAVPEQAASQLVG